MTDDAEDRFTWTGPTTADQLLKRTARRDRFVARLALTWGLFALVMDVIMAAGMVEHGHVIDAAIRLARGNLILAIGAVTAWMKFDDADRLDPQVSA